MMKILKFLKVHTAMKSYQIFYYEHLGYILRAENPKKTP